MRKEIGGCVSVMVGVVLAISSMAAQTAVLDTAAIDKAIGTSGQMQGDVYRVSLPRTDLQVTVKGVRVRPGLALGSWIAFKRAGSEAVAHGDLVLADAEVNPVISQLQQAGLEITALHNHLLQETPAVMYLHFWGRGREGQLAQALKAALAETKTPIPSGGPTAPQAADFDADAIQRVLGHKGAVRNGVLAVSVPRPEKITMMGVEMPPSMGMATAFNFQAAEPGKVVTTGDYVMLGDEVNKVAKALRDHGIEILALHNHMIHGSPELYFMHFWDHDSAEKVAAGLKAGLDVMKK